MSDVIPGQYHDNLSRAVVLRTPECIIEWVSHMTASLAD